MQPTAQAVGKTGKEKPRRSGRTTATPRNTPATRRQVARRRTETQESTSLPPPRRRDFSHSNHAGPDNECHRPPNSARKQGFFPPFIVLVLSPSPKRPTRSVLGCEFCGSASEGTKSVTPSRKPAFLPLGSWSCTTRVHELRPICPQHELSFPLFTPQILSLPNKKGGRKAAPPPISTPYCFFNASTTRS
jgi:hypothetical protein